MPPFPTLQLSSFPTPPSQPAISLGDAGIVALMLELGAIPGQGELRVAVRRGTVLRCLNVDSEW